MIYDNHSHSQKGRNKMEKIVNNDGYLRSGLMDIARQLLNICNESGISNIQIATSPWKEGEGITLLAKADDKPILSVRMDTAYEKE
jgi:hypothetical protein